MTHPTLSLEKYWKMFPATLNWSSLRRKCLSKIPTDTIALSCAPKISKISRISDGISPALHPQIFTQHVRACAASDGAICSKNRKIVPYHRDSPNTTPIPVLRTLLRYEKLKRFCMSTKVTIPSVFYVKEKGFALLLSPGISHHTCDVLKESSPPPRTLLSFATYTCSAQFYNG